MEKDRIVVDTKLDMVEFLQVINDIALEFFAVDGTYQPQIGFLNTMRVFYNECIKESRFEKHDIVEAIDMEEIVEDEDFIKEFNTAIEPSQRQRLDFSNAYKIAMDIVDNKRTSLNTFVEIIQNTLNAFIASISEELGEDRIKKIMDAVKKINNGEASIKAVIEAYNNATVTA